MADWYCYKDKVKMVKADLKLSYLIFSRRVPGLRCPQCGTGYLTEEVVMTTVREAEAVLEGK